MRSASITRTTKETDIALSICLDGGDICVNTGVGFFDHMLTAFAVHGGFGLSVTVNGDLDVDCHHTIEDTGIVLGQAICKALGTKSGIARFGTSYVPMDEALGFCALDLSNRPYLVFDANFTSPMVGAYDTQMSEEFFRAVAVNAGITLHLRCEYGKNDHHITESLYKAFARALKSAVKCEGDSVLSSKGVL